MSGEASYQEIGDRAYGAGNQSWAPGRRLSDAADMLGYSSIEQKIKAMLGTAQPQGQRPEATAGEGTPMPSPSPTPGGPDALSATAQPMSDQDRLDYSEKMRQQLSQPTATPTSTPSMTDRLMQLLGSGGNR